MQPSPDVLYRRGLSDWRSTNELFTSCCRRGRFGRRRGESARINRGVPADFPGAIFVVLHIPPFQPSSLPRILTRSGPLPAHHPQDGERIRSGHIYVAPPDHHLLIDKGSVAVTKGPKENRFRPSIDALFRSAAYNYGSQVIGVVLSGELDDGTSGLWSIKRRGGIAVIQRPSEARFESMPLSALAQVEIDHQVLAHEMGPLMARLITTNNASDVQGDVGLGDRLKTELEIAREGGAFQKGIMEIGELSPFTCPECAGVLVKLKEGGMTRYRCHTGHAYSDSALLEGVMESTGDMLWQVMRSLEEAVMLLRHMAERKKAEGDEPQSAIFLAKSCDLESRSKMFHEVLLKHESLSEENLVTPEKQET
jgi:two-component system, chemotaxis family, protein-glutamate methylesterase/glutaminase